MKVQEVDNNVYMVATKPIFEGEIVMKIPESSWITPDIVAESPIYEIISDLDPWLQIVLFLVYDRV